MGYVFLNSQAIIEGRLVEQARNPTCTHATNHHLKGEKVVDTFRSGIAAVSLLSGVLFNTHALALTLRNAHACTHIRITRGTSHHLNDVKGVILSQERDTIGVWRIALETTSHQ